MRRHLALGLGVFAALLAPPSYAGNPLVEFPERPERLRAVRYAELERDACIAELSVRGAPYVKGPPVPTIDAPVRLSGPLRGVRYEMWHPTATPLPDGPVMDCRLLLALDDLATVAKDRGFVAIRYNSVHRGRWARVKGQRHAAGVAIDIVELVKRDGSVLNILRDFHGQGVRSRTCGADAPKPTQPEAVELREFVCAVDASRSFNLLLTPHYDRRHKDHLHLEVRRGIRWFLTQ